ncbi:MAG: hypothetical protein U1D30_26095 [Planctomycetota bacterium]
MSVLPPEKFVDEAGRGFGEQVGQGISRREWLLRTETLTLALSPGEGRGGGRKTLTLTLSSPGATALTLWAWEEGMKE